MTHKIKEPLQVRVEIRPGPPTAAQLAAWDRLWRELAKPPAAPVLLIQEPDKAQEPTHDR